MTYTIEQLWKLACEFDGIDPDSKFVVFSSDNPYIKKYNFAIRAMQLAGKLSEKLGEVR